MSDALPWQTEENYEKWASKPSQTVNSAEYKELKKFIHKPYRKVDNNGTKCFYFPTYVIFKIKNITEFDFESLSARINGVLIIHIRIDYEDMHSNDMKNDTNAVRNALEKLFKFEFKKVEESMEKSNKQNSIGADSRVNDSKKWPEKRDKTDKTEDIGLKNYLYIQFNRDDPLRLPSKRVFEGQIKQDQKSNKDGEGFLISWTIRKEFTIALSPGTIIEDMIAPFNLLNFKLTLIFEDVDIQFDSTHDQSSNNQHRLPENVKFKFNCMKRVGSDSTE